MSQKSSSVDTISSSSSGELDTTDSVFDNSPIKNNSNRRDNRYRSITPIKKDYRKRERSESVTKSNCQKEISNKINIYEQKNLKPSKCIGVFGMRRNTNSSIIDKYFNKYGPIEDIRIIRDHYSNESKGFCFIKFERLSHATKALEEMNGKDIDGKCVRVDYAIPKDESKYKYKRRNSDDEKKRYKRRRDDTTNKYHNDDYKRRYSDRNRSLSIEKKLTRRKRYYSRSTNSSHSS
ncbi:Transformer-2 sex-determining protein [Strongyloides ratti]|uniref:Transformer-2 sex-determining protein n=1 Tax=Strongyloides ratti TaxID=34506 RepID=A0A090LCU1_STRRB|nr:Transformer-2 sex-determining protein [Strongyloides ratti]CEF65315.1 Transformer-2 sex-determining protein [Strongyloides ratti]